MASKIPELETSRLRLRAWRPEDLPQLAGINADPRVTEYLLGVAPCSTSWMLAHPVLVAGGKCETEPSRR